MCTSSSNFPNGISSQNLENFDLLKNFYSAESFPNTSSKANDVWLDFAKKINCPIPDSGPEGFKDSEGFGLVKNFIDKLQDHIEHYKNQYYNNFQIYPDIQLNSFSIKNINFLQDKIEILDTFNIWKMLISLLSNNHIPFQSLSADISRVSDSKDFILLFSVWIKKNNDALLFFENLTFSNINLRSIPKALCMFKNLKELNLSNNHIIDLPKEFKKLKNLEVLNLKCNEFTFVPKCLFDLPRLKQLYLAENPLNNLNESLKRLREKNIEIDLIINEKNQKEIDKAETKEIIVLLTGKILLILGILFFLNLELLNERK